MYKKAAQMKVRFTFRGQISVEDLFDLTLAQLNTIYKELQQQRGDAVSGLLLEHTAEDDLLALKLEIVRDVFDTKKAESDARKAAAEKRAQKARIMEIIASKKDADLASKSLDDLTKMLEDL